MQKSWTIGANDACDIRVNRPYVSGKHCRLEFDGMNWCLEDFGSTNGTFINGVQLKGKALVQTTDRITLGKTQPTALSKASLFPDWGKQSCLVVITVVISPLISP